MDVLRVYDPAECDSAGVPLDWECCHACHGDGDISTGPGIQVIGTPVDLVTCERCAGHGSLKMAALVLTEKVASAEPFRCEDCGHPMNAGTWEKADGTPSPLLPPDAQTWWTRDALQRGLDIAGPSDAAYHYSPCDEGCRHGAPYRFRYAGTEDWAIPDGAPLPSGPLLPERVARGEVQASWRAVDVRTLGWPHDLRPERLAVLCLRCYAKRTTSLWRAAGSTGPATAATSPVATTAHTSATAAPASTTTPTL